MSLTSVSARFLYSGATNNASAQSDPTLSLGGFSPDDASPSASECYRQANLDGNSTVPYIVNDTQTDDGGGGSDPEVGDWLWCLNGAGAGGYGRITAVNYGTGDITIDRPLPGLPVTGNDVRTNKKENVFPDVTADEALNGTVDYRMLYFLKTNAGSEDNFRFFIQPIVTNGCDIEIFPGGEAQLDTEENAIATAQTSPFGIYGRIISAPVGTGFQRGESVSIRYGVNSAGPFGGSGVVNDQEYIPVWLKRTVPAGNPGGHSAFALLYYVDDAVSQDAGADPDPFIGGFIFSFDTPETPYALTVIQDRLAYTDRTSRIIGTVKDGNGNPVVDLQCYLELVSGPGTLTASLDGFTDTNGQIVGIYTSPSTLSSDPVIRLVVPTTPEL